MEEERAAVRAVLHFGAKEDTTDDNATGLRFFSEGGEKLGEPCVWNSASEGGMMMSNLEVSRWVPSN